MTLPSLGEFWKIEVWIWRPVHPNQTSEYDFGVHLKGLDALLDQNEIVQLANLGPLNKGLNFESIELRRMTKVLKSGAALSQELSVRSHQPEDYLSRTLPKS